MRHFLKHFVEYIDRGDDMKLTNGQLFWPETTTEFETPTQSLNAHYDVIVIGAGMSGVLCAYELQKRGLAVLIVDQRTVAAGSTSANTGLLQYSNDIMLSELIEQIGEEDAVQFYRMCVNAMHELTDLAKSLRENTDYIERPSIYYASSDEDVPRLQQNYEALKKHGFAVEYWDEVEMGKHLPFTAKAALKTYGDAEVNPVKFAQAVCRASGAHVLPHCFVDDVESERHIVRMKTSAGEFTAKAVIHASGYEAPVEGKRHGAKINRSYVVVTEPIDVSSWYEQALIWETARPYLYMRTTVDHRMIIGGLDEEIATPPSEEKNAQHAETLLKKASSLFPQFDLRAAYIYGATFGESADNLPFIGEHETKRGQYYLLGYGGNGTVYSMIGSKILADLIEGKPNDDARIVTLSRPMGVD
jgi:glycine/D-amino acid oxidase-like deaminating enzyme